MRRHACFRPVFLVALLGVLVATGGLAGCGVRFVVDVVPADDRLVETVVLEERDPGADPLSFHAPDKVALVEVSGVLQGVAQPGPLNPFGGSSRPVAGFVEALERAKRDTRVKAVLLRVDSPGGSVNASQVMYEELVRFRADTGKPVVVHMGEFAASGGYYLACGADEIVASPSTITGSIGVIYQTFDASEGLARIGIRADAITSGPNKALASPFEAHQAEHRAILQTLVDEFFVQFEDVVREARPDVPDDAWSTVTDGRVVSGVRAVELGLADATGSIHDAFDRARERAGITGARLVRYHRPLANVSTVYGATPARPVEAAADRPAIDLEIAGPVAGAAGPSGRFLYLWDPSAWR